MNSHGDFLENHYEGIRQMDCKNGPLLGLREDPFDWKRCSSVKPFLGSKNCDVCWSNGYDFMICPGTIVDAMICVKHDMYDMRPSYQQCTWTKEDTTSQGTSSVENTRPLARPPMTN